MTETRLPEQEKRQISLSVNGVIRTAEVETRWLLSDFLRHTLQLTGTHVGCEHGVCGACTIIFNDAPIRACLMLAVQADGSEILTVEGLASPDGKLHPVQQALHDHHGLQCGFCTPGFLMTIYALLQDHPASEMSEEELRAALAGNLCRCTGYQGIVAAVRQLLDQARSTHAQPSPVVEEGQI
ncbi:MAG: (2Fe-2S)-binding protein [Chloroflexi bacterium]|nr:MAG: (2Fe-2S)-binding protein [Chloroflexota bacterium]